ncbi:MAG TPA: GntR family transcriptional regulator [Anaerolineaceae bacterium]|nr:GntR family transcriptional regulator [Anaerolineaceae bacterium]
MNQISLAEKAYATIKKDIITCVLDPGSQIAQSKLVQRYDFGITPIREALKRLEQEGYVQSVPRFGYIITPINIKDIDDIYDLRLILEKSSVRLAAQRASDKQLAQLLERANFSYRFKDTESYGIFLELNNAFHVAIALTSGNRKLADTLANLLNEMTRIFHLGLDLRDSAEEMRNEHLALAEAISMRNVDDAEQIVEDQILSSRRRVLEMFVQRRDHKAMNEIGFPNVSDQN